MVNIKLPFRKWLATERVQKFSEERRKQVREPSDKSFPSCAFHVFIVSEYCAVLLVVVKHLVQLVSDWQVHDERVDLVVIP